jgi:hypothetical protein
MKTFVCKPMKLFPLCSVFLAMLIVSCARYISIAPSALMDHSSERLQLIVPGDVVRLTMKNGEVMKGLKVTGIDSGKIEILEDRLDSKSRWQHATKTLMIATILEIQKRNQLTMASGGVLLAAENTTTHQYYYFTVGQDVKYKTHSYGRFENGRIAVFSDSTITFLTRKKGNVSIPLAGLAAFRIARSNGRKLGGGLLIGLGCGIVAADTFIALIYLLADLNPAPYATGKALLGLAGVGAGIALITDKKIDFDKSWRLKPIKLPTDQ